jgi:hypothetical protein
LRFRARRVYLVMGSPTHPLPTHPGSPGGTRPVRVLLDGRPIPASVAGGDVHSGAVAVGFDRLYRLVNLLSVQTHTLTVEAAPGVSVYAFTFG